MTSLQFCKQWLWIIVLTIVSFALYEQACKQIEKDISSLQYQIDDLENTIAQEMQLQQDLARAVASQNDPAWVELCLIRGLGVVPQGYTKVVVTQQK